MHIVVSSVGEIFRRNDWKTIKDAGGEAGSDGHPLRSVGPVVWWFYMCRCQEETSSKKTVLMVWRSDRPANHSAAHLSGITDSANQITRIELEEWRRRRDDESGRRGAKRHECHMYTFLYDRSDTKQDISPSNIYREERIATIITEYLFSLLIVILFYKAGHDQHAVPNIQRRILLLWV